MSTTRVALVTGANKGLGFEVARGLARLGLTVLLGSRDPAKGEEAAVRLPPSVTPVRLDVTSTADAEAVAALIRRRHGRLDVLVNNAGAVFRTEPTELTAADLRRTFEVTLFGAVTMIHTLLPLLRLSEHPQIVNVASTTASLTLTTAPGSTFAAATDTIAYASAKSALVMATVRYATAFAAQPDLAHVRVNAVTPGHIATDLNGHTGPRTAEQGARVILDLIARGADAPSGVFLNEDGPVPW